MKTHWPSLTSSTVCVLWRSCQHRPFPSQRQQKAGQSSPNLHPRDFSRLLAFKYFFHHYKTVFPKKKATTLFCYDFWNDFADMKRRKNKHTQFCSPPRSQGLMVWLLSWSLLSKMAKSFPSLSSRDLSFFQEEAQPGASLWRWWLVPAAMRWTVKGNQHFPGSMLGTSESPWTYFYSPQGEKYHPSSFQSINIFQGTSMSVIQMKRKKAWKPIAKTLLSYCFLLLGEFLGFQYIPHT